MEERNTTQSTRRPRFQRVADEIARMPCAEIEQLAEAVTARNRQLACMVAGALADELGLVLNVREPEPNTPPPGGLMERLRAMDPATQNGEA